MNISIFLRTWIRGRLVGKDAQGNKYYEDKKAVRCGQPRRWVIYKGRAEASKIPAEWHAWLHFTTVNPPELHSAYPWQKDHLPNMTGTPHAYKPKSLRGIAPKKGYEAWKPADAVDK